MLRVLVFLAFAASVVAGACADINDTPLTTAASRNDAAEVRRILATGTAADEMGAHGVTALMVAARFSATEVMVILLDAGADPNRYDLRHRWTPLLHAIHKQSAPSVRLLLERGADPNRGTPGGLTPLLMAADDPNPAIVTLLLAKGANPRIEGPGGTTPLTQAVSGGALTDFTDRPLFGGCHPSTVRAFLDRDPALRVPDNAAGRHALWWARFNKCEEVLRLVGQDQRKLASETSPPQRG